MPEMQENIVNDQTQLQFPVRDAVQKAGLLTVARNLRAVVRRDIGNLVSSGCPSPAPNVVKMAVVRHYVESRGARYFVETGTFLGSMVEHIAETGAKCITIEIDDVIHDRALAMLKRKKNIHCLKGDSAVVLPEVLKAIDQPAVFWLDGHYSGGFTGKAEIDTPVSAELQMILDHGVKGHVILIDDARDFTGQDGYPRLSTLLALFEDHAEYRAQVSADIIRIFPR
jgi:hypothetical protein